jgi:hypothetical protein
MVSIIGCCLPPSTVLSRGDANSTLPSADYTWGGGVLNGKCRRRTTAAQDHTQGGSPSLALGLKREHERLAGTLTLVLAKA